ncbi:MAG: redoxin domain-containing protein [Candidatus Omnitrophica bacterium]|nr:redoxin domain-containing protein [Candidatus Omnitrophota bacterium]
MKLIYTCCLMLLSFVTVTFAQDMPGLKVGVTAPDFVANDFRGKKVQLSNSYKEGPVILIFYRGSWCPYCNAQLQQLQANLSKFKEYNASLIAVSVDKIDKAAEAVEGYNLEFDIVSNPKGDILEQYGLVFTVPDELNKKYKEQYDIDLEAASGRTDHVIAIPATYIIDTNGKIVFAYANEDYKIRTSSEEILEELKKL